MNSEMEKDILKVLVTEEELKTTMALAFANAMVQPNRMPCSLCVII